VNVRQLQTVATDRQRNIATIGTAALYVGGLIGCITAYVLIRAGSCPISLADYYLAHTSLALSAFGAIVAGLGAIFLKSIRLGVAFGAGLLIWGAIFLLLAGLGVACSGI